MYLYLSGMIFIDRKKFKSAIKKISDESLKLTKTNRKIIIFPQGTRTKPGVKSSYKPGIYSIAKSTGLNTVMVALDSGKYWCKGSFIKYPGTIKVRILPSISNDLDKKTYMNKVENTIE